MLLRCIVILVTVQAKVSIGHHSNSLFHKTRGFEHSFNIYRHPLSLWLSLLLLPLIERKL